MVKYLMGLTGPFAGVQGSFSPHSNRRGVSMWGTNASGRGPVCITQSRKLMNKLQAQTNPHPNEQGVGNIPGSPVNTFTKTSKAPSSVEG